MVDYMILVGSIYRLEILETLSGFHLRGREGTGACCLPPGTFLTHPPFPSLGNCIIKTHYDVDMYKMPEQ